MSLARSRLAFALLAAAACAPQPPPAAPHAVAARAPASPDDTRVERLLPATRARIDDALTSGAVDRAFDEAFDRIAADPVVSSAAGAVFKRLGDDPGVEKAGAPVVQALGKSPEFRGFVERVRLAHPNDFDQALDQTLDGLFAKKEVDGAIARATEALMALPAVQSGIGEISGAIMRDGKVELAFTRALLRVVAEPKRLERIAAKIGARESDPDFEKRLGAYLAEPTRLDRLLVSYAKLFGDHPAPRRAIAGVLGSEAFLHASAEPIGRLLSDEDFRQRAVAAIVAVVVEKPELDASVRGAMTCPAAERGMIEWLTALAHAPDVTAAFAEAFERVAEAPEFAATLEQIYL